MPPVFRLVSMLVTGMLMLVTAFLYHRAERMLGGKAGNGPEEHADGVD